MLEEVVDIQHTDPYMNIPDPWTWKGLWVVEGSAAAFQMKTNDRTLSQEAGRSLLMSLISDSQE